MTGLEIVVVVAIGTLIGAIIGYIFGRSDEKDSIKVDEQCCTARKIATEGSLCIYACEEAGHLIHVPHALMSRFNLDACPPKAKICWTMPKGATQPSLKSFEAAS